MLLAAMLSDAHVRGAGAAQDALVDRLETIEAERVFLLGDIFDAWWGLDAPDLEPTLGALRRLAARSAVTFVPGNHDFALGPLFWGLGAQVASRVEIVLGGRRFLLVHGDEADRSAGYALARRVLRGRAFDRMIRALGPQGSRRALERLSGASRASPSPTLLQAQERWAQEQLAQGFDVVVLGHSHAPGVTALQGGTLVNLGDPVEAGTWLEVDHEARFTLRGAEQPP